MEICECSSARAAYQIPTLKQQLVCKEICLFVLDNLFQLESKPRLKVRSLWQKEHEVQNKTPSTWRWIEEGNQLNSQTSGKTGTQTYSLLRQASNKLSCPSQSLSTAENGVEKVAYLLVTNLLPACLHHFKPAVSGLNVTGPTGAFCAPHQPLTQQCKCHSEELSANF